MAQSGHRRSLSFVAAVAGTGLLTLLSAGGFLGDLPFAKVMAQGIQILNFDIAAAVTAALSPTACGTAGGLHFLPLCPVMAQGGEFMRVLQGVAASTANLGIAPAGHGAGGFHSRDRHRRMGLHGDGLGPGCVTDGAGVGHHTFPVAEGFGGHRALVPLVDTLHNVKGCLRSAGVVADARHRDGRRADLFVIGVSNVVIGSLGQGFTVQGHRHGGPDLAAGHGKLGLIQRDGGSLQRGRLHRQIQRDRLAQYRAVQGGSAGFEGRHLAAIHKHHTVGIRLPAGLGRHHRLTHPYVRHSDAGFHRRQFFRFAHVQRKRLRRGHRRLGQLFAADLNRDRGLHVIGRSLSVARHVRSEFLNPKVYALINYMADGKRGLIGGQHVAAMALARVIFIGFLPLFESSGRRRSACSNIFGMRVAKVAAHLVKCRPACGSVWPGMGKTDGNLRRALHGHLFQFVVIGQRLQAGHLYLIGIRLIPVPGVASRTEVIHHIQHGSCFALVIGHIVLYLIGFPGGKGRNRPGKHQRQRCQQRQSSLTDRFQPDSSLIFGSPPPLKKG